MKLLGSITLALGLIWGSAKAYETDQYTATFYNLKDSTEILDEVVNRGIRTIAKNWTGKKNVHRFARQVEKTFNARQLEYWVNLHKKIHKFDKKEESIFKTTAWYNSPIVRFKGIAATFKLANVLVGSDKMSHFFGVGGIYYKKAEVQNGDKPLEEREAIAIRYGANSEERYWGELTTNVFSNADLVVNYEGYKFFRSLSLDNIVAGKKAIIKWEGNKPIVQRAFTFKDHVNDFWSEALLPNKFQISMRKKVDNVLRLYCTSEFYLNNREMFIPKNYEKLMAGYSHLRMKVRNNRHRLDRICEDFYAWAPEKRQKFILKQKEFERKVAERNEVPEVEETRTLTDEEWFKKHKSALPGCKSNLRQAMEEYVHIQDWKQKLEKRMHELVQLSLEKEDLVTENLRERLDWLLFYEQGRYLFDKPLMTQNEMGQRSLCLKVQIPLKELMEKPREEVTAVLQFCGTEGNSKKVTRLHIKRHSVRYFSMKGYYPLDDRAAYTYRTLPYFCKWY